MATLDDAPAFKREKSISGSSLEKIDEEKAPVVVEYSVDDQDSDYVDPTIITKAEDVAVQVCTLVSIDVLPTDTDTSLLALRLFQPEMTLPCRPLLSGRYFWVSVLVSLAPYWQRSIRSSPRCVS